VAILSYSKRKPNKTNKVLIINNRIDFDINQFTYINQELFDNEINNFEFKINANEYDFRLLNKINTNSLLLENILDLPRGIEIGGNSELIKSYGKFKILVGRDISRYQIDFNNTFIDFDYNDKSVFKDFSIYNQPKLLIQRIRNLSLKRRIIATYDESNYLCTNTLRIGILKDSKFDLKYILAIINSKLINYLFLKFFLNKDIYAYQLAKIPIKNVTKEIQSNLSEKTDFILNQKINFTLKKDKFLSRLIENLEVNNITKKIESFYESDFKNFISELNKQKINLSLIQQDEWSDYFKKYSEEILELLSNIHKTESEIDQIVYKLYGLTEEEIKIIEENS